MRALLLALSVTLLTANAARAQTDGGEDDTAGTATEIAYGYVSQGKAIDPIDDVDYYRIEVDDAEFFQLDITMTYGDGFSGSRIVLYRSNGIPFTTFTASASFPPGQTATRTWQFWHGATSQETIYVRMSSIGNEGEFPNLTSESPTHADKVGPYTGSLSNSEGSICVSYLGNDQHCTPWEIATPSDSYLAGGVPGAYTLSLEQIDPPVPEHVSVSTPVDETLVEWYYPGWSVPPDPFLISQFIDYNIYKDIGCTGAFEYIGQTRRADLPWDSFLDFDSDLGEACYSVSAVYPDYFNQTPTESALSQPISTEVVEGGIREIANYTLSPPVIDGLLAEWDDVLQFDIANRGYPYPDEPVILFVQNDDENLYLAFDNPFQNNFENHILHLYVDSVLDYAWAGDSSEGFLVITIGSFPGDEPSVSFTPITGEWPYDIDTGDSISIDSGVEGDCTWSTGVQCELSIDLDTPGISAVPGQHLGLYVGLAREFLNENSSLRFEVSGSWPTTQSVHGFPGGHYNYWWTPARYPRAFANIMLGFQGIPTGQVALRAPQDGEIETSVSPEMQWYDLNGASSYDIQVWESSTGTFVVDEEDLSTSQHVMGPLNPVREYSWHVRGRNEEGVGPWSETWSFTTGIPTANEELPSQSPQLAIESVFPNPAVGLSTVLLDIPNSGNVQVVVYDVLGRLVEKVYDGFSVSGRLALSLDAGKLSSGTYIIRASNDSESDTRHIVVMH